MNRKEKILEILKKHHLNHYGDVDKAVEELSNLLNDEKILKIVADAFDNHIYVETWSDFGELISNVNGKREFLKEVKEKINNL